MFSAISKSLVRHSGVRRAHALLLGIMIARGCLASSVDSIPQNEQLRIFFSTRVMMDLKDHDARAAVKAWTQALVKETGIQAEAVSEIGGPAALVSAFVEGRVDAGSMPTDEYIALSRRAETSHLFFPVNNGDPYEQYLLLVHADAGLNEVADLRGRKLIVLSHHRMSLGEMWLDTLLAQQNLPVASALFGNVMHKQKAANVVLPLFFRNTDACLITQRGFATMTELNPQVGKRLQVLATSPRLVPTLFCFSGQGQSAIAEKLRHAVRDLHKTVYGQQILTTYQLDQLAEGSAEHLQSARILFGDYERLCGSQKKLTTPQATVAAP